MIYVTRKERFNAAHKMWKPEWSEEKNKEVYGKCANVNWHGHNYDLFVTVKGELQETGYVVDLKLLSTLINEKVIEKLINNLEPPTISEAHEVRLLTSATTR